MEVEITTINFQMKLELQYSCEQTTTLSIIFLENVSEHRMKPGGLIVKIVKLVRLTIIGVVLITKICILLKIFHAFIKFKYVLITAGYLVLNAVKLWIYVRYTKHPEKVIHYTNANHEHHYDDHDHGWDNNDWSDWRRNSDEDDETVRRISYLNKKPFSYSFY